MTTRYWILDFMKGIAILLVMLFHFVFDLQYFAHLPIDCGSRCWWLIGRTAACLFIAISGICFALGYEKAQSSPKNSFLSKTIMRSAYLLGIGLLITLATGLFVGEGMIVFVYFSIF